MDLKDSIKRTSAGQAIAEYLIIFAFLSLFSVNMVITMNEFFNDSLTSLAFIVTQQLSVGTCEDECFFNGYLNLWFR